MWVSDKVIALKEIQQQNKRNKIKLKKDFICVIKEHVGQCGLSDEIDVFIVEKENGELVEITSDLLKWLES